MKPTARNKTTRFDFEITDLSYSMKLKLSSHTLIRLQEALARLEEIKKSVEAKMTLRQNNLNPERPG